MSNFIKIEKEYEKIAKETIDRNLLCGFYPHSRQIKQKEGMKEHIRMYRHAEFETVMQLVSEPFATEEEAKHFSEVFNDCFPYNSTYEKRGDVYYVYSGWVLKQGFVSYSLNDRQKGAYWMFANWS